MRTAFKVATVFTGAVACAAAFTPAAEAATTTTAKTQLIEPEIFKKNCAIGPSTTSVVLTRLPSAHHGPTCVGEKGKITLSNTYFSYFCAGNNYGQYWITGDTKPFNFYAGSEFNISARVAAVSIKSWSGGFKCST
jgi:hypothetical protein